MPKTSPSSPGGATIHPTALVEEGARLENGVTIGAFAFIGPRVRLGAGTTVAHHATVDGNTSLGEDNEIHPYAFIGGKTHDRKYQGGDPGLTIGCRNTFREYTTVHCATTEGSPTTLGDDNLILAYSHIAHDCIVGNHLTMSSHAALGGHVRLADHVNIGWGSGLHQFCRAGAHAMIGATAKVVQDVPPYMIADGSPATVRTINKIGLERAGFDPEAFARVRHLFKLFYKEGLNRRQAIERLEAEGDPEDPILHNFLEFARTTTRGLA